MSPSHAAPCHADEPTRTETIVLGLVGATYPLYLVGALYPVGAALGWWLALAGLAAFLLDPRRPEIPLSIFLVLGSMGAMLIAVWAGLLDFRHTWTSVLKSSVGWAKGWALLAVYPFAALGTRISTERLAAAWSRVAVLSLALSPFLFLAAKAGLPEILYVSPLEIVGGATRHFFVVRLFSGDFGELRLWYFAPWAPAAALCSCLMAVVVWRDPDPKRRRLGLCGALVMVYMSGSRLGLLVLAVVFGLEAVRRLWRSPWIWTAGAILLVALPLAADGLGVALEDFADRFTRSRLESSRVRSALARLAVQRWQEEAFWWGHGTVERGPWSVEFMPIGSHHTWLGLLFVKGLVGVLALFVFFLACGVSLWRRRRHPDARSAGAVLLVLFLFTPGENLEILAYLVWPALLVLGNGLKAPIHRHAQPELGGTTL